MAGSVAGSMVGSVAPLVLACMGGHQGEGDREQCSAGVGLGGHRGEGDRE